jgi:hypothetical protein
MADAGLTAQLHHVALLENVADQTVALAGTKQALIVCRDTGGILAAMLQYSQRIVECLVNRLVTDDSDDSAHAVYSRQSLA